MEYLPFWHFFQKLETELGYRRSLDKYRLFLDALNQNYISYDADLNSLNQFCKALFLQNYRDEVRLFQLLGEALEREKAIWETIRSKVPLPKKIDETIRDGGKAAAGGADPPPINIPPTGPIKPDYNPDIPEPTEQETSEAESGKMYFKLPDFDTFPFEEEAAAVDQVIKPMKFLLTDEYFNVSRRQMIKAWQSLRHREKGGRGNQIDIVGTVKQIARDGMLITPHFHLSLRNRDDTIIIFADYLGSMTPFHALSDRLIQTALNEGNHSGASVFYFRNHPTGYVYRRPNLSQPIKLKEALLKANRNFTLAIVISDAGAARNPGDTARVEARLKMTDPFLETLSDSCASTIWLNPLPMHRWNDNAAAEISKRIGMMVPMVDEQQKYFQDIFRARLKQKI